jgi:bifunctional UDP-N-acetylglucosamine pyrophosphorylase/glucosamine-1-phosphate N-acetyltransferase
MSENRAVEAIILAAGKGTRMNSDLPKVLHEVADRPMIHWVVDAVQAAGAQRIVVVIGFAGDKVRQSLSDYSNIKFVEQNEQLGTAHAVTQAAGLYERTDGVDLFVLCGDGPLIERKTLEKLLNSHRGVGAAATLATAHVDDPTGYGRILRSRHGRFLRIVEHKDAQPADLQIHEVNPSIYCFDARALFDTLPKVSNDNSKGEYYLTDVFSLLLAEGQTVHVVEAVPPEDVLSINTPEQLAKVDDILRRRINGDGPRGETTLPGGETFA